jgi:hypothetical protein
MKNRQEELKFSQNCNRLFSDQVVPMYEIVKEMFEYKYAKDPITNEYIYEIKPGNKKKTKIRLKPTHQDIVTLKSLNELVNGKKAFIDFFRFFEDEYGKTAFDGIELSYRNSRDYDSYKKRIVEIGDYENFIPVISIKKGLVISESDLYDLIQLLRKKNSSIALRITDDILDNYKDFIETYFLPNDYIMLDIREQEPKSKIMEFEEFQDMKINSYKIILNSPRKRTINNNEYENRQYTKKINNDLMKIHNSYEFAGFGDFGGLKDDLPRVGGNGKGSALALIYFKKENSFYSIVNSDTSLGCTGYLSIIDYILKNEKKFDSKKDCPAIEKIRNLGCGNFASWNNITLTRYIHQQATK